MFIFVDFAFFTTFSWKKRRVSEWNSRRDSDLKSQGKGQQAARVKQCIDKDKHFSIRMEKITSV